MSVVSEPIPETCFKHATFKWNFIIFLLGFFYLAKNILSYHTWHVADLCLRSRDEVVKLRNQEYVTN